MLTQKQTEKLQRKIYYNMPDHQKIKITSDFYVLGQKLKNSKIIEKKDGPARTVNKNN